jgi:hypothetical protein
MMFGTSLALIAQEFQGRERGTALGIWGATTAAAVSTGRSWAVRSWTRCRGAGFSS